MKNFFKISLILTITIFSGCGKDEATSNNGSFDNNKTVSTNNATTGGTTPSNNTSNNGDTTGMTNASNNKTGGTSTNGTTGAQVLGVKGFYERLDRLNCDIAFNCTGRIARDIRSRLQFSTEAECNAKNSPAAHFLPTLISGEAAGRFEVDEANADAYLTNYRESICDGAPWRFSERDAFVAKVPVNGLCATYQACGRTAYCKTDGLCEGVCTNFRSCNGILCESDEYCSGAQICEPKVGNGGACRNGETTCVTGSGCNFVQGGSPPVCQTYYTGLDGEECATDDFCQKDLICNKDTFTCEPLQTPTLNGQCKTGTDDCEAGTYCTNISFINGFGTCLPHRILDQSCLQSYECEWGLFCTGTDYGTQTRGACKPAQIDGETCTQNLDCQSSFCDGVCSTAMACIP